MVHGVKYRIAYNRKSGAETTIDILQRDYAGAITSLLAAGDPLRINWDGAVNNIYKPTIGSGATIKVISTPLALLDLYTDDPQEFIVKIWDGETATNLRWQGFITPNIYNEAYGPPNTEITIYCNDGMVLLENITYKNSSDFYVGKTGIYQIFINVLAKLEITFVDAYINHSLAINNLIDKGALFLWLDLFQNNFIDESEEVMSCRDVLDSILGGLGLVMIFRGPYIYYIDPIDLHDFDNGEWKNANTFGEAVDPHDAITDYLEIQRGTAIEQLPWGATDGNLDIQNKYDLITVKYDPYNYQGFDADFGNSNNYVTAGEESQWQDLTDYEYQAYYVPKNWDIDRANHIIVGIRKDDDTPIYVMLLENNGGVSTLTLPLSDISTSRNQQLKLSMEVYVQATENNLNVWDPDGTAYEIYKAGIPIKMFIGGTQVAGTGGAYAEFIVLQDGVSFFDYQSDQSLSQIGNVWTKASALYDIEWATSFDDLSGPIRLDILDAIYHHFSNQVTPLVNNQIGSEKAYKIIIRNITIETVDKRTGKSIGNDGISTYSRISTNVKAVNPYPLEITTGTGPFGISRGAFSSDAQSNTGIISGLYRTPVTPSDSLGIIPDTMYTSMALLLQSFNSQYKQPRFILSGTFNALYLDYEFRLRLVKHTAYLGTRALYMVSGIYKDKEEMVELKMIELVATRETIT